MIEPLIIFNLIAWTPSQWRDTSIWDFVSGCLIRTSVYVLLLQPGLRIRSDPSVFQGSDQDPIFFYSWIRIRLFLKGHIGIRVNYTQIHRERGHYYRNKKIKTWIAKLKIARRWSNCLGRLSLVEKFFFLSGKALNPS